MTTTSWKPGMGTNMTAGQASMKTGYKLSAQLLRDAMEQHAPQQLQRWDQLAKVDEPQILSVDGSYDHMHHLLQAAGLPHIQLHEQNGLDASLKRFGNIQALLINCASEFPQEAAHRAAEFVSQGGLLITSDWAVENVIQVAFPGTIERNGSSTSGHVYVNIEPGSEDIYPEGGFLQKISDAHEQPLRWWLEPSSYPFRILSEGVRVLLYSSELKDQYGNGSVMVEFDHGKGKVIHMISHAFLQHKKGGFPAVGAGVPAGNLTMVMPQEPVDQPITVEAEEVINDDDHVGNEDLAALPPKPPCCGKTLTFTTSLGASSATVTSFASAEAEVPDFDAEDAQTAAASTAVFLTSLFRMPLDPDTEDDS